jgi:high-affinity Fe2+/Pb2+ permease
MRLIARWGVAVLVSAGGFALAWWVCQEQIRLDEGVSLGIAGAVLAVLLSVGAWWAPRGTSDDGSGGSRSRGVVQKARAGRDVYMSGRDMTVDQRHRDE